MADIALAARTIGYEAEVEAHPDASNPLCAFRAIFTRAAPGDEFDLARQIPLRVTNRKTGSHGELTALERMTLQLAAKHHGGTLELLETAADLDSIAALLGRCDRFQLLTPAGHQDMFSELRFTPAQAARTRDGLDVDLLELNATDRAALTMLSDWRVMQRLRQFGGGTGLEQMARRAIPGSVAVGLVRVSGRNSAAFVQGGRVVQRVWLTATQLGLAIHPWTALPYLIARLVEGNGLGFDTQEIQWFSSLTAEYERLFPTTAGCAEVMLWRISRAASPTAQSLRRPVDEVFQVTQLGNKWSQR